MRQRRSKLLVYLITIAAVIFSIVFAVLDTALV